MQVVPLLPPGTRATEGDACGPGFEDSTGRQHWTDSWDNVLWRAWCVEVGYYTDHQDHFNEVRVFPDRPSDWEARINVIRDKHLAWLDNERGPHLASLRAMM